MEKLIRKNASLQPNVWTPNHTTLQNSIKNQRSERTHLANGPCHKSLNFIFPTKYVISKSLKFSHWPSKLSLTTYILQAPVTLEMGGFLKDYYDYPSGWLPLILSEWPPMRSSFLSPAPKLLPQKYSSQKIWWVIYIFICMYNIYIHIICIV